jgi:hypothetical protein
LTVFAEMLEVPVVFLMGYMIHWGLLWVVLSLGCPYVSSPSGPRLRNKRETAKPPSSFWTATGVTASLLKVLGRYLLTYRKAEATEKVLETLNGLALEVDLGSATLRSMVQLAKADIWKDDPEEALRWAYLKVALASFALGFSLLSSLRVPPPPVPFFATACS